MEQSGFQPAPTCDSIAGRNITHNTAALWKVSTPPTQTSDLFCVSTGTHSLRYHYLALSEPGPELPEFLAVGYVDDQPFIRYDSRTGKAEPQAAWMAPVDAQYWETETKKQKAWEKVQQVEMWTVMGFHNQSSGKRSRLFLGLICLLTSLPPPVASILQGKEACFPGMLLMHS